MTNRTRLLAKAMGAFGLSAVPLLFLIAILVLTFELPNLCATLLLLSLGICFFSGLTLALTSGDSKARVALASSVTAMGFILLGLTLSWFKERDGFAILFYFVFILVLLVGILREASLDEASVAPVYLKWGLGLSLVGIVLCMVPPVGLVTITMGAFCFYFGVLKWALELYAAARNSSGIDSESLSL